MTSFKELSKVFDEYFTGRHFPDRPANLYDAAQYLLSLGGKRIRPVCVLMGCELFGEISQDAMHVAGAVELFHNFSLIHDDIMDKAPLRRGVDTVHVKWGESTALLSGDVMLVVAYDFLNKVNIQKLPEVIRLFNKTAKEVCEGQQMDMDFENTAVVSFADYEKMIILKTSVLLASSFQMGALIGGAGERNQHHLYEFGKNLGIAFQVQDDYLDAFGNPEKFGKQIGGDIIANKKTFLQIHAWDVADNEQKSRLQMAVNLPSDEKVKEIISIFKACGVDTWASQIKEKYFKIAMEHLEKVAVLAARKQPLIELAEYLLMRDR